MGRLRDVSAIVERSVHSRRQSDQLGSVEMSEDQELLSERRDGVAPSWYIRRAVAWQAFPASWTLLKLWDPWGELLLVLAVLSLGVCPVLASVVHRSWRLGLVTLAVPFVAFAVMWVVFIVLMMS